MVELNIKQLCILAILIFIIYHLSANQYNGFSVGGILRNEHKKCKILCNKSPSESEEFRVGYKDTNGCRCVGCIARNQYCDDSKKCCGNLVCKDSTVDKLLNNNRKTCQQPTDSDCGQNATVNLTNDNEPCECKRGWDTRDGDDSPEYEKECTVKTLWGKLFE